MLDCHCTVQGWLKIGVLGCVRLPTWDWNHTTWACIFDQSCTSCLHSMCIFICLKLSRCCDDSDVLCHGNLLDITWLIRIIILSSLCIHATLIMHDWLKISFKLRIYRDSSLLDSLYEMFDMSWMKKYVIINIRFIINCQTGPRAESFNLQTLFTACLHKHFSVHYIKSHKYENIT